ERTKKATRCQEESRSNAEARSTTRTSRMSRRARGRATPGRAPLAPVRKPGSGDFADLLEDPDTAPPDESEGDISRLLASAARTVGPAGHGHHLRGRGRGRCPPHEFEARGGAAAKRSLKHQASLVGAVIAGLESQRFRARIDLLVGIQQGPECLRAPS